MFRTPLNLGVDLELLELVAKARDGLFDVGFAFSPRLGHALDDVVKRIRIEIPQALVLDLPLNLPDAQTMRDRSVDIERFARDRFLLRRGKARERPHVVQAVGELDDDDADIFGHRQKHLAKVFDLRVFLRLVGNPRQLRDAVNEARDLFAELRGDLLRGDRRVFDDVVEQCRGDRLMIHLEVGEDARDGKGMPDIRLARSAALAFVSGAGRLVGALQLRPVRGRIVGTDAFDQF